MKTMLKAALLVCALSFVGFQGVYAQGGGGASTQAEEEGAACKGCKHNLDTNEHWFGGWFNGCTSGDDCYDCHAFNACHDGPQAPYTCGVYHWLCGQTSAMLDLLDKALAEPNAESAIVRVANSAPKTLRIVSAGYVLVKNCSGGIVAAYRVPKSGDMPALLTVAFARSGMRPPQLKAG